VWIGTTVEDQKRADERVPELLKVPAAVRFLSVEPLLMDDTDTLPLTEEALAKMEPAFKEVGNVFEVTGPDNTLAHLHAQARAAIR
jgi:protein gp37